MDKRSASFGILLRYYRDGSTAEFERLPPGCHLSSRRSSGVEVPPRLSCNCPVWHSCDIYSEVLVDASFIRYVETVSKGHFRPGYHPLS